MNILLLFVSTLHTPGGSTSVYSGYTGDGDKRENYPYLSQLEPGSKYFFNKLAEKGEKFGRVIALCTDKALEGVSFAVDGTDIAYENISAYELFRRRMTAFLGGNDMETDIFAKASGITPTYFDRNISYTDEELNGLFLPVEISFDGAAFAENISSIVNAITEQTDEHIDLYLNAQGGARTSVQIINTVMNMLQSRSVKLKEVSIISFDKSKRENPLADETDNYLINDLAAALNAFLEYGRGDMFIKYYMRYKRRRGIPATSIAGVLASKLDLKDKERLYGKISPEGDSEKSHVIFYNAEYNDKDEPVISVRDSVALEDKVGVDGAKFDFEIVEPGARFRAYIELDDTLNNDDEALIVRQLAALNSGILRFGHKTTRGYGQVRLENVRKIAFENVGEWLNFDMYNENCWETADDITLADTETDTDIIELDLELKSALSIRSYTTEVPEDGEKTAPDYKYLSLRNGIPVILGTTWAGTAIT